MAYTYTVGVQKEKEYFCSRLTYNSGKHRNRTVSNFKTKPNPQTLLFSSSSKPYLFPSNFHSKTFLLVPTNFKPKNICSCCCSLKQNREEKKMDFFAMKRKKLQSYCKKHGIPANLKNIEMAKQLSLIYQVFFFFFIPFSQIFNFFFFFL